MEIDKNVISTVTDPKVAQTVAKQLWPSMLFLVVMSIISLVGARWWLSGIENQLHIVMSFWLWFIASLVITGYGIYVLILDARIQLKER